MRALLNIGTEPGQGFGPDIGHDARGRTLRVWLDHYASVLGYQIRALPGEEQVIILDVKLNDKFDLGALHDLSEAMQQDCIALWNCETGQGSLIGPNSGAWQPFDPTKFYMDANQGSATYPGAVIH